MKIDQPLRIILLATVSVVLFASSLQAATCTLPSPNGTNNWATSGDWTNATVVSGATGFKLPAASVPDIAVINNNASVEVTSAVDVPAGAIFVNNQTPSAGNTTATLKILTGGVLGAGAITVAQNTNSGLLSVEGGTLGANGNLAINQNGTVNVSSGSLTVPRINIGTGVPGVTTNGTLNISGGAVIVTNGSSALANAGMICNGSVNLSGGNLTFIDPIPGGSTLTPFSGTNTVNMTGGSFVVAGETSSTDAIQLAQGTFNLMGGQFMLTNGQVFGSGNPTINIYGTNTVIRMDRLNLGTTARAMKFGFFFTNSGVSTIACPAAFMTLDFATINIDGSAYTGGPGTYTLFSSPNFTGTLTYTANITAPFPGLNAVVSKSGNNLVVTLTEPPAPQSTWDGDSNGYWSVAANWAGNVAPVASNALIFAGTVNSVTTNDLTADTLFKGITFTNTGNGQSFSLGGNSLKLAGNISSADVVTPDAISDSITLNQQLAISGIFVNLGSNHDLTISGVFSEDSAARGFTKAGTGTLTLSGTNTYTGVTTVSGGILNVSNNLALGTTAGNTVINGGAPPSGFGGSLRLPGGITLAEPLNISAGHYYAPALWSFGNNIVTGQISGSGRIQTDENGPGTLTLSGGISATGGSTLVGNIVIDTTPINAGSLITFAGTNVQKIAINVAGNSWVLGRIAFGGTVQLGVDNALPTTSAVEFGWSTLENSVGTLDLNGHNQTVASIGNSKTAVVPAGADLRIIGGGTLTVNQTTNTTFSGVISDGSIATALVKANTGTLNLTGTNAYTGNTTVNGGTLQIGVASIAANSTVTVATNATLQLDFMETNQVAGLVLNGVSQPAGVYNNSSTPTYILGSGSLQVGSATPNPATLTNSVSGGVLNLSWPAGQGWRLEQQTNSLSKGLSTNWVPAAGSSVSSTNITIDSTKPTVFYRLAFP